MSAHEAAVRAVAAGMHSWQGCTCGTWPCQSGRNTYGHILEAEAMLAALATDPDVRAALVKALVGEMTTAALDTASSPRSRRWACADAVDAVLAALTGERDA